LVLIQQGIPLPAQVAQVQHLLFLELQPTTQAVVVVAVLIQLLALVVLAAAVLAQMVVLERLELPIQAVAVVADIVEQAATAALA
jgi:hypothetical protein